MSLYLQSMLSAYTADLYTYAEIIQILNDDRGHPRADNGSIQPNFKAADW